MKRFLFLLLLLPAFLSEAQTLKITPIGKRIVRMPATSITNNNSQVTIMVDTILANSMAVNSMYRFTIHLQFTNPALNVATCALKFKLGNTDSLVINSANVTMGVTTKPYTVEGLLSFINTNSQYAYVTSLSDGGVLGSAAIQQVQKDLTRDMSTDTPVSVTLQLGGLGIGSVIAYVKMYEITAY